MQLVEQYHRATGAPFQFLNKAAKFLSKQYFSTTRLCRASHFGGSLCFNVGATDFTEVELLLSRFRRTERELTSD